MEEVLVKDAVAYLTHNRPDEIRRLQAQYSGLGERAMFAMELAPLPALLTAQIAVAVSAIEDIVTHWQNSEPQVRAQISRANKWEQYGAITSLFGSSSVLAMTLGDVGSDTARSIAALLGTVGAVTVLQRKHMVRDLFGVEGGLSNAYKTLIEDAAKALAVKRQLTPYLVARDDGGHQERVIVLLREANSLVAAIETNITVVAGRRT